MRVYEYAEQNSLSNQQVLDAARQLGIEVTSHASGLDEGDVTRLDEHFTDPDSVKQSAGENAGDGESNTDDAYRDDEAGEARPGSDAAALVSVGGTAPAGGDDLIAELERLKRENTDLKRDLVAARDPAKAGRAANEDRAYADKPKHYKTFVVNSIGGPSLGMEPQRVEHACDESEAIRRVCARRGLTSNENRFRVDFVEYSKTPPPEPKPRVVPRHPAQMLADAEQHPERLTADEVRLLKQHLKPELQRQTA